MAAERKTIRVTRIPLLPEDERILRSVRRAELAKRGSRIPQAKLEALAGRGQLYVVLGRGRELPRAHLTESGLILIGEAP